PKRDRTVESQVSKLAKPAAPRHIPQNARFVSGHGFSLAASGSREETGLFSRPHKRNLFRGTIPTARLKSSLTPAVDLQKSGLKRRPLRRRCSMAAPHKRNTSLVGKQLERHLAAYALVAGAAGVSLLAATPAPAEVIYTPKQGTLTSGKLLIDL